MRLLLTLVLLISLYPAFNAQETENVFLITLDGLRWQEVYGGAVDSMLANEEYTKDKRVIDKFLADSRMEGRKKLLPWFWSTLAKEGQLIGNRWEGSKMNCSNRFWFSYPGYNEILTGYSDPEINSNAKKYNPNETILEWISEFEENDHSVAAFCSWDVFPYIINDERSGIYVNAAFEAADHPNLNEHEKSLNILLKEVPSPWPTVRLDAWTHHYALEFARTYHPKVVYISYGETDDFAHDGRYDHYLNSAHQTDQWLGELWEFIQSDSTYKDKTSMIITTDHGRGTSPMSHWKSHGTIYKGSDQIWAAAIGPDIPKRGEIKQDQQLFQNQIARTVTTLLGLDYMGGTYEAGRPIKSIVKQ